MITYTIDELTPCLIEISTGEIYETEVVRLKRKSFLSKYNKRTGWYVNWGKFPDDVEIYALVLKGTVDVQGLIAIRCDELAKAVHIVWSCVAPWNNKLKTAKVTYQGIGGHLFAIAAELSFIKGYEGYVFGDAINEDVLQHYVENFQASHIHTRDGTYRFIINPENTHKLMEVYNYEWTEEEL